MVDETGQPYAYTGDDPVNGVDPLGLSGRLTASQQANFAGLLRSLSSTYAINGEAATLGNELNSLASEFGSLQQCRQVNPGDPNICYAYPGHEDVGRYLAGGGSACLLTQITKDEGSGHKLAADITALSAFGVAAVPEGSKVLYRYGGPETPDSLSADAKAAVEGGLPHGVSTSSRLPPRIAARGEYGSATVDEINNAGFSVVKTGEGEYHYTIEIPEPVTPGVTDTFNELFFDF